MELSAQQAKNVLRLELKLKSIPVVFSIIFVDKPGFTDANLKCFDKWTVEFSLKP